MTDLPIDDPNLDYEALIEDDPWTLVMLALEYEAQGALVPEDLQDAVAAAAAAHVGAALVRAGAPLDAVERQFMERDWVVRLKYDSDTGEAEMAIDWEDGTSSTASGVVEGAA